MFAKTALTCLAAFASLSVAASAHAASVSAPDPDVISVTVPVADLNLSSSSGAAVVLQRVHDAAETICGDAPDVRQAERFGRYQSCVKGVVDQAVAKLDNPIVTALNGHSPRPVKVADSR